MAPISFALNSTQIGYQTVSGKSKGLQLSLSHLFYMDDLKLLCKFAGEPEELIKKVVISRHIHEIEYKKMCEQLTSIPKRLLERKGEESNSNDGSLGFPTLEGGCNVQVLGNRAEHLELMNPTLGIEWRRSVALSYNKYGNPI